MDNKAYAILLGAPKCGTTTIAAWLSRQDSCALSRKKETRFFTSLPARNPKCPSFRSYAENVSALPRTETQFREQFSHDLNADLRVEATTDNLSDPETPDRLRAFRERDDVRSVKLVAIVRDPVDRIRSEFDHTLRLGWESGTLMEALHKEDERIAENFNPLFHHVMRSRYAEHLERFRRDFAEDLLIVDYHCLNQPETRRSIASHVRLDLTSEVLADERRLNEAKVRKNRAAVRALRHRKLREMARRVVPKRFRAAVRETLLGPEVGRSEVSEEERNFILRKLRDDIELCLAAEDIPTANWTCLR